MSTKPKRTPEQQAARDADRAKRYPSEAAKPSAMAAMADTLAPAKAATPTKPATKKPAAKTVKKPATPTTAKPKPSAKDTVKFVARVMKPGQSVTVLSVVARPSSGAKLYSHTHAALTILGMFSDGRPAVPKAAVITLIGQRAVDYHSKELNFEAAADQKIRLSITGMNEFKNRLSSGRANPALANAYTDMFLDGKLAPVLEVKTGNTFQAKLA